MFTRFFHLQKWLKHACFCFIMLAPCVSTATHIVGGELYYSYLGGNQYQIQLTVYRDCFNGIPPFDDPAYVGIWDSNNNLIMEVPMSPNDSATVPSIINSNCMLPPTNICVRVANYYATVTLPPIPGGYQLGYQRCCRNSTILNVVNPLGTGATFYATIPGNTPNNSNPKFDALPPAFICSGYPFVFDHSASDADGDSLVYSICTPLDGASTSDPAPLPSTAPPPFANISFQTPFNISNLMGGTPLTIDPQTGLLTATPNTIGQFVVGICVSEYRNGVLLSTSTRDYQINVVSCPQLVVSALLTPSINCGSNTVQFTNFSQGAATYLWDFGDPTVPNSTSTALNPSYTYPALGTYTVTLVAYSNVNPLCTDTSIGIVNIYPDYVANFTASTNPCSNTVVFNDSSNTASGATNNWQWNFGDNSNGATVTDPTHTFPGPGTYVVTLQATSSLGCVETITQNVTIDSTVTFQPLLTGNPNGCEGQTNNPLNITISSSNGTSFAPYQIAYTINGIPQPNIITSGTSTNIPAPNTTAGNYTISISGITSLSNPACPASGTTSLNYTVAPTPTASISGNQTVCINDPVTISLNASNGTAPYEIGYTINGGPVIFETTDLNGQLTIAANSSIPGTTTYNLVSVASSGINPCTKSISGSATIEVRDVPTAVINPSISTACQNDPPVVVNVTGSGSTSPFQFTYSYDGGGIQTATSVGNLIGIPMPTTSPGTFNVYINSISYSNGPSCSSNLNLTHNLVVLPQPTATAIGDTIVCKNENSPVITFTGSGNIPPYTFQYTINGGAPQVVTSVGNSATITVPTSIAGVFNYEIISVTGSSIPACSKSLSKISTITIKELPTATLFAPDSICLGSSDKFVTFAGANGIPPFTFSYSLNGVPANDITTALNNNTVSIQIPTTALGSFTYLISKVTDAGPPVCERQISKASTIVVDDITSDFIFAPISCPYDPNFAFIESSDKGVLWSWEFGDGAFASGPRAEHSYLVGGNYEIALVSVSSIGCRDTITKNIDVIQPHQIWMPNAFTPNGDFRNEKFLPVTTSVSEYNLSIYNRWGMLVFQSLNPNEGWNGKTIGGDAPMGVYVFVLSTTDLCGQQDVRKGTFNLVR
jgi:gliding motility-associated-like protein